MMRTLGPDLGCVATTTPKRSLVYGGHAAARHYHRPTWVHINWVGGQFDGAQAVTDCSSLVARPVFTDDDPAHLSPCPSCFPVTIDLDGWTIRCGAGAT